MMVLEQCDRPNIAMRIARLEKLYHPDNLEDWGDIFESFEDFIEASPDFDFEDPDFDGLEVEEETW